MVRGGHAGHIVILGSVLGVGVRRLHRAAQGCVGYTRLGSWPFGLWGLVLGGVLGGVLAGL